MKSISVASRDKLQVSALERDLAAIARQYRRSVEARDKAAQSLEVSAAAECIQRLLVAFREAGPVDACEFYFSGYDVCQIALKGLNMNVMGRTWCSFFAHEGWREWTEPFSAIIVLSADCESVTAYSLYCGTRATLLDPEKVRRQLSNGKRVAPRAPSRQDGWAFVYRMGDISD
jgi:hypothetical protein